MTSAGTQKSSTYTGSAKYHLEHKWTIENFSLFFANNLESTAPDYPYISSTPFSPSRDKRFEFKINLFPKGDEEANKDSISVFLDIKFNGAEGTNTFNGIKYKISILNARNKKEHSRVTDLVFTKNTSFGWSKFLDRKYLFNKLYGCLPKDRLTINAEVSLFCDPFTQASEESILKQIKELSIEKNCDIYGDLLNSGDNSDVILVVGGKELKAHKAILAAHSPVFKAMFKCAMKEKSEGRVEIKDLTVGVAKEMLKFIYTGKIGSIDGLAEGLLQAADKYGLPMLKQLCNQFLCDKVNTKTVANLLIFADLHSIADLKTACVKYIRAHMDEVMLTKGWPLVEKFNF